MKTGWKSWLLIILFVPAFFLLPLLKGGKRVSKPVPAPEPICYLSGDVKNRAAPETSGFESAGTVIRLNLAANTIEECKMEITAYCRTQLAPHPELSPNLKAYFRSASGEVHFVLREGCVVSQVRPEADAPESGSR